MISCVNKSLYHKYSDISDKYLRDIERLVSKEKSLNLFLYEEIQFEIDDADDRIKENYDAADS